MLIVNYIKKYDVTLSK